MSFFSGLFGTSKPTDQPEVSASAEIFNATRFSSAVQPATDAIPSAPSSSSSSIPSSSPSAASSPAPNAAEMFSSAFDPIKLHPLAGLGDNKLDFLALDEDKLTDVQGAKSVLPSRGWTDDLCVGTGTTYLSGLALGGAWGFREGLVRPLGKNPSMKLRINSILNGCSRRGTFVGNSLGVLAIFYNLSSSSLDAIRGKHDIFNSLGAGALAGGLYKSTAGIRPAFVGATLATGAAGAWSFIKTLV